MDLNLTKAASISDYTELLKKELLSYVSYSYGKRCRVHPQYIYTKATLEKLGYDTFMDDGCITLVVADTTSADLENRYGDIVLTTINNANLEDNIHYGTSENSKYSGMINPNFPKGVSDIEFTALKRHALSGLLMQVLEVQEGIDFTHPHKDPINVYANEPLPQTSLILISQTQNAKTYFYGPFEYTPATDTQFTIDAVESYERMVSKIDATKFDFLLDLKDTNGNVATQFIATEEFNKLTKSATEKYDWLSNEDLINILGRIAKQSDASFSKKQVSNLKRVLTQSIEDTTILGITPERVNRIMSSLENYERWRDLPEEIKLPSIEKADPEDLADFVFNDNHFSEFFDRVKESSRINEQFDEMQAAAKARTEKAKRDASEAERKAKEVHDELKELKEQADALRAEIEENAKKELGEKQLELENCKKKVAELRKKESELKASNKQLEETIRVNARQQLTEAIITSDVIKNETIKCLMQAFQNPKKSYSPVDYAFISFNPEEDTPTKKEPSVPKSTPKPKPAPAPKPEPAPTPSASMLVPNQEKAKAESVIADITSRINNLGCRDLDKNDAINLLICLTQGYILTLAGQPGTGKTTLATILAGALGLRNSAAPRFVEASVERGWTSYKDFVGYYNPINHTIEKSNAELYNAFELLDAEGNKSAVGTDQPTPNAKALPYVILLDEANLSPVEHWWAPFLKACDRIDENWTLPLGGDNSFTVPPYLRFIATINYDRTTEELSKRFLDRSWTITLDPIDLDYEDLVKTPKPDAFSNTQAYTYDTLQRIFGIQKEGVTTSARSKLKEVVSICASYAHPISPRSRKMMLGYISAAEKLMDLGSAQDANAPVDYAILQKILPQLEGADDQIRPLLEMLAKISGLPMTTAKAKQMIETGQNYGYYRYFV